jgi:hypothetical protein
VKTDSDSKKNKFIAQLMNLSQPLIPYIDLSHIVAAARHPESDDIERNKYAGLRVSLDDEFEKAIRLPERSVKRLALTDLLTETAHTFPIGNALEKAGVLISELMRYLSVTRPEWVVMGPGEIDQRMKAAWKRLPGEFAPKLENGMVSYRTKDADGQSGARWQPLWNYQMAQQEKYKSWQKRLTLGRYTLKEAALAYSKNTGGRAPAFFNRLMKDVKSNKVSLYEPGQNDEHETLEGVKLSVIAIHFYEVYFKDLNEWLENNKAYRWINWRFPDPGALDLGNKKGSTMSAQPPTIKLVKAEQRERKDDVSAVVERAIDSAVDPSDSNSSWAAFIKLAESKERPAPLLGLVEGEGVKYLAADGDQYLTKKNFRDRHARRLKKLAKAR